MPYDKLMFQIGVEEVGKKIADIKSAFDDFNRKYGVSGIDVKVNIIGAETLINQLAAIGDPKQLQSYRDEIERLKGQLKDLETSARQAKQQNARATRQMTDEERRLAQALQQSSDHMQGQSHVLNDLKSMATQYLGVWGAQQFLHNIIEIGGQLEMQRLSISAILGDAAQGRALFEDIKRLAVKSPFGVVELDQYTKQLSAYGFQSNELYGMTKRLADIAAGAGTDVGRLALALGHVRSEGALTGYTLRQFAMNNIPMLQKLSERLTEVEGKIVSTAEIRKRVSKKEIGYDDVIAVIKDLTDEGGMFYNMQETIAESVKAKFKNLRDSMDIMYGEMAESGAIGGVLKLIAQGLTSMTREWKVAMPVIMTTVGAISMQKVAMLANNKAMVAGNIATGQFTAAQMEMQARTGVLTKSMLLNAVAAKKVSVADAEAAGAVYGLSMAQLQHVANMGKVTNAMNIATFGTSRYTRAQLEAIAAMRKADGTLGIWSRMKIGVMAATNAVKGLGLAISGLWAIAKSFAWIAALDLAIGAVTKHIEKVTDMKDRIKEMGTAAQEGFKNMREFSVGLKVDGKLNDSDYKTQIDSMVQQLKEYSPQVGNVLAEVFKIDENGANVHSLAEQFEMLKQEVDATTGAYRELEKIKGIFEAANDKTDGVIDDSFRENVEDYAEALTNQNKAENDFLANRIEISEALEKARGGYEVFNKAVEDNVKLFKESKGKQGFSEDDIKAQVSLLQSYATQFQELRDKGLQVPEPLKQGQQAYSMFSDAMNEATTSWQNYSEAIGKTSIAHKRMMDDAAVFAKQLVKMAEGEFGHTVDKFTESEKRAVQIGLQDFLNAIDGFKDMSAEARHALEGDLLRPFNIKIDADVEEAYQQVSALQSYLEGITDKEWTVKIKTVTSAEDLVQKTREAYKADTDSMTRNRDILIKRGYNPSHLENSLVDMDKLIAKEADPIVKDALDRYHKSWLSNQTNKALSEEYGFSLIDNIKGGKTVKPTKGGSQKDTQLDAWKEEFNELKAFYTEYKRWAELVGKDKALAKIQEQGLFAGMFRDGKPIYDISEWGVALDAFLGKIGGGTAARDKFRTSVKSEKSSYMADQLKEELDRAGKEMQEYISQHADQFNLYKRIVEQTGDKGFAVNAFTDGRIWDDAARAFERKLQEVSGETAIDFTMSDRAAEEHFKNVAGGYDLWKKIVEITRKNYTDSLEGIASATEKLKTNEEKIKDIEKRINDLKDKEGVTDGDPRIKVMTEDINRLKGELFELSPIYERIFSDRTYKGYGAIKDAEETARELIGNAKVGAKDPKTGKASYYTSFYMDGKEQKQVTMTTQQLERLKRIIDDFFKDEVKKNPFATLIDSVEDLWDKIKDKDKNLETQDWAEFADALGECAEIAGTLAGQMSDMFDALGNESMAEAMDDVRAGAESVSSIASGFSNGGLVGGIVATAGEAMKWVGRIAGSHDKKLDKAIQKSQREVKKLQTAYDNMADEIDRRLTGIYGGSEYTEMLGNYKNQLSELEKQRNAESKKKKTDADKLADYDQQIKEMRDNIKYFAEETAKALYDIDVKSWAKELTDAVVDAWAKGEDAAEAWHDKVKDLVKDVTKNILSQKVVEAALEPVLDIISGEMYDKEGKLNEGSILNIAKALENASEQAISGLTSILDTLKQDGIDLAESSGTSSAGGIKGVTEQTADLLASYVNAIRADMSIVREIIGVMSQHTSVLPSISVTVEAQLQQLTDIAASNRQIVDNTKMIADIYTIIRRATVSKGDGFWMK